MIQEHSGFIHPSAQHLPANARGVLLLYAPYNGTRGGALPEPTDITIYEIGGQPLRATIEPVKFDQTHADTALFRVIPQGGFKPGKSYHFSYFSGRTWAYPSQIEVTIDDAVLDPAQAAFTIKTEGAATRRLLSLPQGGICAELYPSIVQDITYNIAQPYLPYADALVFFSQERELNDAQETPFASFAYRSNMCADVPFGGSAVGVGKERVYAACTLRNQAAAIIQVRDYVGMLEVSDKMVETPVLDMDFNMARGEVCAPLDFLGQAIANQDIVDIRTQTCALHQILSQEAGEPPSPLISTLASLTESGDQQTRQCAGDDLLFVAYKVKTLEATMAKSILQSMLAQIDQGDTTSNSAPYHTLGEFAAEINRRIHDDKASNALTMSLFDPLVPRLTAILTGHDADKSLRYEASRTLEILRAKDAIPALLAALPDDQSVYVATTLLALAPDDNRVPQALIDAAAKGNTQAAHLYVDKIGKQNPKETVTILIRLLECGDKFALYNLTQYIQDDSRVMETLRGKSARGDIRAAEIAAPLLETSDAAAAVTLYMTAIGDDTEGTRAIDKLGEMGATARPAVSKLFQVASQCTVWRRRAAVLALAKIGGDDAFNKQLIAVILKNLPLDSHDAMAALVQMGAPAIMAKPQLFAIMRTYPIQYEIDAIASVLPKIGVSAEEVSTVLKMNREGHWVVRPPARAQKRRKPETVK